MVSPCLSRTAPSLELGMVGGMRARNGSDLMPSLRVHGAQGAGGEGSCEQKGENRFP